MTAMTLLAVSLLFGPARPQENTWRLTPRFGVGMELEYFGAIIETSTASPAKFEQTLEVQASMLVMDVDAKRNAEVGCLTVVRHPDRRSKGSKDSFDNVARFHFDGVKVSTTGKAVWGQTGAEIALPPDGKSVWELGYFIEGPKSPLGVDGKWMIQRAGEPNIHCQVLGPEKLASANCVKVVAVQESANWKNKQIQIPAWRNQTIYWFDAKDGVVQKLSRDFQIRKPGDESPKESVQVRYELATSLRYHGPLLQERVADVKAALAMQSEFDKAVAMGEKAVKPKLRSAREQLEEVLKRTYSTPYRPAMRELAKASAQFEAAPAVAAEPTRLRGNAVNRVGLKARPFTVHSTETNQPITGKEIAGKATVLVFVDPSTDLSLRAVESTMRAVEKSGGDGVQVLVVSTKNDPSSLENLKENAPGKYTLCVGSAMEKGDNAGLPHTLFIDAGGVVRANMVGLGPEFPSELSEAIYEHKSPATPQDAKRKTNRTFLR